MFAEHDDPFSGEEMHDIVFIGALLDLENSAVVSEVMDYLDRHPDELRRIFETVPTRVRHLRGRPVLARRVWYGDGTRNAVSLRVLAAMLSAGVIPDDQHEEALHRAARQISDSRYSEEEASVLVHFGFDAQFRRVAFEEGYLTQFGWANSNSRNIIEFLERNELDIDLVRCITEAFSVHNHPFELKAALNQHIRTNAAFRDRYLKLLEELNMSSPRYLSALTEGTDSDGDEEG
jgi:hypothetical protein